MSSFPDGSDAGDTERLEELPLCSCRMEAPRVESTSHRVTQQCMATESINGEVCLLANPHVKYSGTCMKNSVQVHLSAIVS